MEPNRTQPLKRDPYRVVYTPEDLQRAMDLVLIHKWGIRRAAGVCGVPKSTLERKYFN